MYLNLQRFLGVALILTLTIVMAATPADAASRKKHKATPAPDRSAEIVIEASSGYVISEKNADKRLYPASLTKMMTLYLTFEAIEKNQLGKSQRVFVSKRAAAQEPSSLGLRNGEAIRVEDAILAIATKSANDCAVVLAEAVGDSEERFARMMTAKARALGMNNTNFVNASGLNNPKQYSTARDMSILSQALLRDYPKYYRYFGTSSFTYAGNTYFNHNKLMSTYRGMDGLKTGYVYASGYNLAASAVRNGTRLIGVVFGGQTAKSRNNRMAAMLDQGFNSVRDVRVASLAGKRQNISPVQQETVVIPAPDVVAATSPAAGTPPQFKSMGLVVDQGDTTTGDDSVPMIVAAAPKPVRIIHGTPPAVSAVVPSQEFVADFQPRALNTASLTPPVKTASASSKGSWVIQVGAFSSHAAGVKALNFAKANLRGAVNGVDSIAPLMTNRGMVYRARLAGLDRHDATQACKMLKGNCLVLATE